MSHFVMIPPFLHTVAFIAVGVVVLWCVILLILAYRGGWSKLARMYRATTPPSGTAYYWQGGNVGWVNYNGCLTVHTTKEGMFLSMPLLFRFGHPTLFFPWRALQVEEEGRLMFVSQKTVTFTIGNPQIAALTLPMQIFKKYEAQLQ